jgi:hypothetical protein
MSYRVSRMRKALWIVPLAFVLVYAGWRIAEHLIGPSPPAPAAVKPAPKPRTLPPEYGGRVKILQFYPAAGEVAKGARLIVCYGVANAKSARIEPEVGDVPLSPNRCVEVTPKRNTRYTLTAEGTNGGLVSESFRIKVRTPPVPLPEILFFRDQTGAGATGPRTLCFQVMNATRVTVEPPAVPPSGAIQGCFYVAPEKTTTYTLTAADDNGHTAEKQVTVTVP